MNICTLKAAGFCFCLFLFLPLCFCSSTLISMKDKSYYGSHDRVVRVCLFPITAVQFDPEVRDFVERSIENNSRRVENRLCAVMNESYLSLARKKVKSKYASVIDTVTPLLMATIDKGRYGYYRLNNKDRTVAITVLYPGRHICDSIGIDTDIGCVITNVTVVMSSYYVPICIPTPVGIISGHATGPAFRIKGNYLFWDYRNDRPVCAGNFQRNFSTGIAGENVFPNQFNDLFTVILNKSPYWSIPLVDESDGSGN